jgi:WhiB family redox-sensing transcriptional regulator
MNKWQDQAACAGMDVELFYPVTSEPAPQTRHVLRVCASCPVRESCLAEALDRGERYGIWGGTLPEQRGFAVARRAS